MEQMKENKLGINWYTAWFVLYVLLIDAAFNLHHFFRFGSPATGGGQIILVIMAVVAAILLSNGIGLLLALLGLFDRLSDLWLYTHDFEQWFMVHSCCVGSSGFIIDECVMIDLVHLCLILLMILNMLLSAIRCRSMGLKMWMALIPLYNPLVPLLTKK